MKPIAKLTFLAAVFLTSTTLTYAAEPQETSSFAQELHLTKEQQQKVQVLRDQLDTELGNIDTTQMEQSTILNVIRSGEWDEAAVNEKLTDVGKLEYESRYYNAKYLFDVNKLLTTAQRSELRKMLQEGAAQQ